jgi:chemotaxis response regulator CheB
MSKRMSSRKEVSTTDRLKRKHPPTRPQSLQTPTPTHLILIGASAGGHTAVKEVIKGLSDDLPATVVIIRHMPAQAPSVWGPTNIEAWLRDVTHAQIRLIAEGDCLQRGVIYLTPPGMTVTIDRQRFRVSPIRQDPLHPSTSMPSLNPLRMSMGTAS